MRSDSEIFRLIDLLRSGSFKLAPISPHDFRLPISRLTQDDWFTIYQTSHPDADREEFSREWEAFVKFKAERLAKKLVQ